MGRKRKFKLGRRPKGRGKRVVLWLVVPLCALGAAWWFWISNAPSQKASSAPEAIAPLPVIEALQQQPQAPAVVTQEPAEPPPQATPAPAPVPAPPAPSPAPVHQPKQTVQGQPAPEQGPEKEPDVNSYPRSVRNIAEAQIALARQGISSGPVDGLIGGQTRAALTAFQQEQGLAATGELDRFTKELLLLHCPPVTNYTVLDQDVSRLQPVSATWLGKSQQTALDYENILELVSERCRAHPNYVRKLNPTVDWARVEPGVVLTVPDTTMPVVRSDAAFIRIYLSKRLLQVFDAQSNLVAHFPCSIAQNVAKRPSGELRITAVAPDPNYTFNPAVFPESEEARNLNHKLILPPGPNNPVGVAWISLDKPGYGMHGTPQPEQVGRTESHGCFRLANWNATHLLQIVRIGMPVYAEHE